MQVQAAPPLFMDTDSKPVWLCVYLLSWAVNQKSFFFAECCQIANQVGGASYLIPQLSNPFTDRHGYSCYVHKIPCGI